MGGEKEGCREEEGDKRREGGGRGEGGRVGLNERGERYEMRNDSFVML